jgi:hypothetical protein
VLGSEQDRRFRHGGHGSAIADPDNEWALFLKHTREGNVDQALIQVTPEVEQAMKGNEFSARTMAHGYALMDDALRWLRSAIDGGFINYPCLERDECLRGLRGHPRFQEMMAEVRPRWEAVVAWERGL